MKKVIVIGGGVAGMQTAATLLEMGLKPVIVEKDDRLGGKLNEWHRLFPSFASAREILDELKSKVKDARVMTYTRVKDIRKDGVVLGDGSFLEADAIVVASGFDLFRAELKEELGYGIYDNVYTSVDLERMFNDGRIALKDDSTPQKIAFLHCVGSRDEKVNQRHCSKVCCVTGVKQAIEIKEMLPDSEVYNFYMDIRMFGPGYEEMYRRAQEEFNIHFIRGRISEASETFDKKVQIKAEDTLIGRPLKMTVDMLVLLVGMTAGDANRRFANCDGISLQSTGFLAPADVFTRNVCSCVPGIFYAGTVTAPKNVGESINEGTAAAHRVAQYLNAGKW